MTDYDIRWLPGEQIIVEHIPFDFSLEADMEPSTLATLGCLDAASVPVPYVLDVRQMNLSFGEMMEAMAAMTRGEMAAYTHPMLKELIVVTTNAVYKLGAAALTQEQYNKVKVRVFDSMDDALEYARSIAPKWDGGS
jgi:hypothetical protein